MKGYLVRRFFEAGLVMLGASLLIFGLLRLAPGDPVDIMFGPTRVSGGQISSPELKDQIRAQLGLNQPLPGQYLAWLGRALRLDFGYSFRSRRPVAQELSSRLPATAMLAGFAFVVQGVLVGVGGTLAAVRANGWLDHAVRLGAIISVAMPTFWLGLLLLYLFAVQLQWVMVSGEASLRQMILPGLALGLALTPQPLRVLRASLLAELGRLYLVFGRAKGLSEWRLILRHALPNALLPVITLLGMNFGWLLGGAVIAETVFSWPGMGRYLVESIAVRDYPVIQGYGLLVTTIVVITNLLVDLAYTLLDPRVRLNPGGSP